jgi:hypothetical protein
MKAAFLGAATLVACYFWIPLVKGWIAPSNPDTTTTTTETMTAPTAAAPAPVAATPAVPAAAPTPGPEGGSVENKPVGPSWLQIAEWMKNDPRTMTAPPLAIARDPFESPWAKVAEAKPVEAVKPKTPVITPTAAGLVLTSTIIGPQRRVAQINGRTYAAGQIIVAGKEKEAGKDKNKERDKESLKIAFRLVEVQPRRVVLEANGQQFELTIPEPGKSEKIELLGAVRGDK